MPIGLGVAATQIIHDFAEVTLELLRVFFAKPPKFSEDWIKSHNHPPSADRE